MSDALPLSPDAIELAALADVVGILLADIRRRQQAAKDDTRRDDEPQRDEAQPIEEQA